MNAQTPSQEKPLRRSFFADLKIGTKLGLGFGVLVALIFFSAVVSFVSSALATKRIQSTDAVRVPSALLASQAQADLLRMLADVRGYLALADADSREYYQGLYQQSSQAFEADLEKLQEYSPNLGGVSRIRLEELQNIYDEWQPLPGRLFDLHDDQLDREPAYRKLAMEGTQYAGQVIIATNLLIAQQGQSAPTAENLALMADMAKFQGNFSAMFSALRGYVTTRNRIYRGEYEVNLSDNQFTWERLYSQKGKMTTSQQELLERIAQNRTAFLILPDQIFTALEGDHWREDLYLFRDQAQWIADRMNRSLNDLVQDQQSTLKTDLSSGRRSLNNANWMIVGSGVVALLIGLGMALLSQRTIANPIRRLTNVAEQIRGGDLDAQAKVESRDEIGTLATTFNNMTSQLRRTLLQVRKEKRRADDLLEVVIPIGVELTTEKDFNRLLEKMLLEAKNFCRADSGLLYLLTDHNTLNHAIVRNDSLNMIMGGTSNIAVSVPDLAMVGPDGSVQRGNVAVKTAIDGVSINLSEGQGIEAYQASLGEDPCLKGYAVKSLLSIPLRNPEKVLGVMLLINPQDAETKNVIPFDANLQQMMESFSSLAVAALEAYIREQALRAEVAQLRIEIDKAKQQKAVDEIVDTDFFRNLEAKARSMRNRSRGTSGSPA